MGRLSGGHNKRAVLIFLPEPLMDFDVTKMFHCAHVIWPIILTEGLECGLIAHVVDLGLYTVVY